MRKGIDLRLAEMHVSVLLYDVLAPCVYMFQFNSSKCTAEVSLTIHGFQRYC